MMASKPMKPVRYFGGKGLLASKLLPLIPPGGRPYIEPFAGAANVLFGRKPATVEVLNDIDGNVVNLYRVLQDRRKNREMWRLVCYTPYSRAEFTRAKELLKTGAGTDVERAWAYYVVQNQSLGATGRSCGFSKSEGTKVMAHSTSSWIKRRMFFKYFLARLAYVQIDCGDGIEAIMRYDNDGAVIYVDPPYHPETWEPRAYSVRPDHEYHERLLRTLLACRGAVVLSGYYHPSYDVLTDSGWEIRKFAVVSAAAGRVTGSGLTGDGAAKRKVPRIECVWRNPKAAALAAVPPEHTASPLFEEVGRHG